MGGSRPGFRWELLFRADGRTVCSSISQGGDESAAAEAVGDWKETECGFLLC